ncbi:MAG TPA: aspartate kinase [Bacteroidales bacterium]|nr:aspartate kinase [Bacteroidales bacterium]HOK75608.1 aspartate kinase [Bacteroidales bacterium]HOU31659.1 aspartate kinase [Bacteroidales bacterium]HPP93561.1 aspartate kinase [Bacteroidales bacterium]HQK72033.1 aspartate kinase [Bacteroidales bacterium]
MKVYKFGGGVVKDAEGVKNIARILSGTDENLIVVVSAFGKTTNALEKVLETWYNKNGEFRALLGRIYDYHLDIARKLFTDGKEVIDSLNLAFSKLEDYLLTEKIRDYDYEYDQIVSYGEIWASIIVAGYLQKEGFDVEWVDIRNCLITDDNYRDAGILWGESSKETKRCFDFLKRKIYVTQGFIGGTITGQTTTLGREGSDYTAAVLANMLDAKEVVVWKDVPGILNADPLWLDDAVKLDAISYKEAVEMSFSGAKIIHPKTIKPLHNKNIPLYVKPFFNPGEPGTLVSSISRVTTDAVPVYIRKENQILISVLPVDFSFVMGDNLSIVFHSFMQHRVKVNLVQASAVSINVCVDYEKTKIEKLIKDLKRDYKVLYNDNVEILTVMRYNREATARILAGREILLEQKTRRVVRYVVRCLKNSI